MISSMARRSLHLSFDKDADVLLSKDPLALLIGMVLDQQIPLEKAFRGPFDLSRRLDAPLDAVTIAEMDTDRLAAVFREPPALHRYPASMAARVQALCAVLVEDYGGDAAGVWRGVRDGDELLARVKSLPGFGEQKAKIFVALLGKQLGVTPEKWRDVSAPFGEQGSTRSVADIVDESSLAEVREFKQAMKAANKAKAAKSTPRQSTKAKVAKQPSKRPKAARVGTGRG